MIVKLQGVIDMCDELLESSFKNMYLPRPNQPDLTSGFKRPSNEISVGSKELVTLLCNKVRYQDPFPQLFIYSLSILLRGTQLVGDEV